MENIQTKIIDLGNFNTKADGEVKFISRFMPFDEMDHMESNILDFNNNKYIMEFEECGFDTEFNKAKKDYKPNLLWALDKMGAKDKDNYRVLLGLPLTNLGQADKLREELEGKEFTYTTKETKTIKIREVLVVGEGMSAFYSLPKEERAKDLIIFDIGGRTVNIVEFKKGRAITKDTLNLGTIDLYNLIKVRYNNENGKNLETFQIEHLIEKGIVPMYTDIVDNFIKDILNKAKLNFDLELGQTIWFCGGGSITVKQGIAKANNNFKIMDNPLNANLNGNKRLAKAKGWL